MIGSQMSKSIDSKAIKQRGIVGLAGHHLCFVCNTDFYAWNFRGDLMKALAARGAKVSVICPDGPYAEQIRGLLGSEAHVPITVDNRMRPMQVLRELRQVHRAMSRVRADLYHFHTMKTNFVGTLAASLARQSFVVSFTGLGPLFSERGLGTLVVRHAVCLVFRRTLARAHAVIVQNEDDQKLVETMFNLQRTALIRGSGVDTERFVFRMPGEQLPRRFVYAGRMLQTKGVVELLEAFAQLTANEPDISLDLYGEPAEYSEQSLGWPALRAWESPRIRFHGHCDDLHERLGAYDAFILPTYHGEGLPKALIEAAAVGLFILATRWTGCTEVVVDGRNGLLFEARNTQAIVEAVLRVRALSSVQRQALAQRARRDAEAHFSVRHVIKETINLYCDALRVTPETSTLTTTDCNTAPPLANGCPTPRE